MSSALKIKDQPASERPRERLAAQGADALSNAELIAILLRTGLKGMNAVEVSKHILIKFGSLQSLALASVNDLCKVKGIGRDKAVTLVAAFALAHKMARELQEESPLLDNPGNIVRLLRAKNLVNDVETLQVLLLNTDRDNVFVVSPGDRIAQLVIVEVAQPALREVERFADATTRGDGGFGSSGV